MNRELMYYYQGDNINSTRNHRLFGHSEEDSNNNSKESGIKNAVCNCNRTPETIQCKFCGQSFVGRKQISCQLHKNTIHLMDFMFCIFCKRRL